MDPPVPIPNTEVKRFSADDTALATVWENKSLPGGLPTIPHTSDTRTLTADLPLPDVWNNAGKTRSNPTLEALCIDFTLCYNTVNILEGGILVFPKPRMKLPFNHVETCSIIPSSLILSGMIVTEDVRTCRKSAGVIG